MKSTIKIALGLGNEPVIHFNIVPSDDLRDQLCLQFVQRLGSSNSYCLVDQKLVENPSDLVYHHNLTLMPMQGRVITEEDYNNALNTHPDGLPSRYQIDSPISTDDIFDGQVVAVRFTVGKVYYDILDKLTGKIMRDVDSCDIISDIVKLPAVS